jgi:murein L,D-transpeptidase YcbB/YkuD
MKKLYFLNEEESNRILGLHKKAINEQTLTAKQTEASNAGFGPLTDEAASALPVDASGKIIPKKVETNPKVEEKKTSQPTDLVKQVQTLLGVTPDGKFGPKSLSALQGKISPTTITTTTVNTAATTTTGNTNTNTGNTNVTPENTAATTSGNNAKETDL